MQRLALAILLCCAAWPCAADIFQTIPSRWTWPPLEAEPSKPITAITTGPAVLISAIRFSTGLSDDLKRRPARAIADQIDDTGVLWELLTDDIPLPRPRVEMPKVPIEDVCETLTSAAQAYRLPVSFFIRLIWQESRFDPRAISPVGAQGVAQFMPETAAAMGLKNPFDPLEALHVSARLLRELVGQFGNLGLAAAAYNAGPKRIVDWLAKRGKLPEETRNYVRNITGHAAERWRVTRLGYLAIDVPDRAPCQDGPSTAPLVEVPAPVPVPPKPPAKARMLAKGHAKDRKPAVAKRKTMIIDVSAARRRAKAKPAAADKHKPLTARAHAARKSGKKSHTANR